MERYSISEKYLIQKGFPKVQLNFWEALINILSTSKKLIPLLEKINDHLLYSSAPLELEMKKEASQKFSQLMRSL